MAASQARLLGLSSKKTNCEWQGQQINQARTALSNETANLWNELLNMDVPMAPDVTNYSETSYSFSDGQNVYEIDSIDSGSDRSGYNSTVRYTYYQDAIRGTEAPNTNPQVQRSNSANNDGGVTIQRLPSGSYLVTIDGVPSIVNDIANVSDPDVKAALANAGVISDSTQNVMSYVDADGNEKFLTGNLPANIGDTASLNQYSDLGVSGYRVGNSTAQKADKTNVKVDAALKKIAEDFPTSQIATAISAGEDIYTYSKNGMIKYASMADLENAMASSSMVDNQSPMMQYATNAYRQAITKTEDAIVETDASGRYTSVALRSQNDMAFNLNTESDTNMRAYQSAMLEYHNNKLQYENTLTMINAKTAKIQEQDRTLELRLKNLDTERDALQNEVSTIKKIMEKKVDEVFKTYQ